MASTKRTIRIPGGVRRRRSACSRLPDDVCPEKRRSAPAVWRRWSFRENISGVGRKTIRYVLYFVFSGCRYLVGKSSAVFTGVGLFTKRRRGFSLVFFYSLNKFSVCKRDDEDDQRRVKNRCAWTAAGRYYRVQRIIFRTRFPSALIANFDAQTWYYWLGKRLLHGLILARVRFTFHSYSHAQNSHSLSQPVTTHKPTHTH